MPRHRSARRAGLAVCALLAAPSLAACGGDSEQEETAQQRVCDARAAIRTSIDGIRELPLTRESIPAVQESLQSIRADLRRIREAQPELAPERREEAQEATRAFRAEVESVARNAVASGVTGDVRAAVRTAADQLAASYREALEPIDCTA